MSFSIGIWDDESTRMWPDVYAMSDMSGFDVTLDADPDVILDAVQAGKIDVALVPPTSALARIRELDILPAVSMTATRNPFACIELDSVENLSPISLSSKPGKAFYRHIGEVVLKEHYGIVCEHAHEAAEPEPETAGRSAFIGSFKNGKGFVLELAREWHELVSYPLVHALFVTGRTKATADMISSVRDTTLQIELRKGSWIASEKFDSQTEDFYFNHVGFRLDDMVVASLSDLAEYMYYYGLTKEIPTFTLASLREEDNH